MPVTIVEIPPMKIIGARGYIQDTYGLRTLTEAWEKKIDEKNNYTITVYSTCIFWASSIYY